MNNGPTLPNLLDNMETIEDFFPTFREKSKKGKKKDGRTRTSLPDGNW